MLHLGSSEQSFSAANKLAQVSSTSSSNLKNFYIMFIGLYAISFFGLGIVSLQTFVVDALNILSSKEPAVECFLRFSTAGNLWN